MSIRCIKFLKVDLWNKIQRLLEVTYLESFSSVITSKKNCHKENYRSERLFQKKR